MRSGLATAAVFAAVCGWRVRTGATDYFGAVELPDRLRAVLEPPAFPCAIRSGMILGATDATEPDGG